MDATSYLLGKKSGGGGGPTPTGTINITENGTHDVTNYASANVNVQPDLETKSITITENTTTTITPTQGKDGLSSVQVTTNVSGGEALKIKRGESGKGAYYEAISNAPSLEIDDTSCAYMFYDFKGYVIPPLTNTSNVTNMSHMFRNCTSVKNYNLDNYDTSNVTDMSYMFNCNAGVLIRNLDCSSFDVGRVTNMNSMFNGLFQLAQLDISSFDFTNVTHFSSMFSSCGNYSKQTDGAYADGIPYVYVKDADAQNWVLTANNGHPSTWTTDNVIIKTT